MATLDANGSIHGTDGKFSAKNQPEHPLGTDALGDPPVSFGSLGLKVGAHLFIDETELDDSNFCGVTLFRNKDNFSAVASMEVDLTTSGPSEDCDENIEWLSEHQSEVEAYLKANYGADLDNVYDWGDDHVNFTVDLDDEALTDTLVSTFETSTKEDLLAKDLGRGTFGENLMAHITNAEQPFDGTVAKGENLTNFSLRLTADLRRQYPEATDDEIKGVAEEVCYNDYRDSLNDLVRHGKTIAGTQVDDLSVPNARYLKHNYPDRIDVSK